MKYDIIIIGAGLGGLTAGAKLSKSGRKVLLIEQHDRPGGCATTFERKDFTMEVGLHEMDGLHAKDMKTKIFRDLGVFDKVEFLKVPEFYRFINSNYDFVMPHNPDKATKKLIEIFPNEAAGINAYFDRILNANLKNKEEEIEKNLGEFLDSIIKDENLKLILLGNLGYFHDNPYTLSLSYYSVAQGSYFAGGGNFIKGGSQKLSNYLSEFIKINGGEVLLKNTVSKIITKENKAVGVVYHKTNNETETKNAFSDEIIANAAIPNIAKYMLPKEFGKNLQNEIAKRKPGASLLTIYFGFNTPLKNIGSKYYSTFIYDDSVKSQADILKNNQSDFDKRSFTFVDYSQIDSALAPKGKSTGAVCCIDYTFDWDNLDKKKYKAKKEKVARIFIERLEKLIPGFKNAIEYYEVGTSKTVERYTLNPQGAVYGFAQTPENVILKKIKSIENLHFASAWTKTGGGFSGAIFSGYLCAFDILRKR